MLSADKEILNTNQTSSCYIFIWLYDMFSLNFVFLGLFGISSHAFLLDDNSLDNLLLLLRQEKEARSFLESEVTNLRADIERVNSKHEACKFILKYSSNTDLYITAN